MTLKYAKSCFSVKKLISTRKWRVEHPFAGRNTQQSGNKAVPGTLVGNHCIVEY